MVKNILHVAAGLGLFITSATRGRCLFCILVSEEGGSDFSMVTRAVGSCENWQLRGAHGVHLGEQESLTRRGKCSSPKKKVVPTGSQKTRCLLVVFLCVPGDLPRIGTSILNALADLTVILELVFFFLLASCQLQALMIIILQQACSSTSYSFVTLSLTKLKSPVRRPHL